MLALFLLRWPAVRRRRWPTAALFCLLLPFLPNAFMDAEEQGVLWTNIVNASVEGTGLRKTNGWDGVDDAGATSAQQLESGDGYIEFTVGETNSFWLAGLSHGNEGTSYAEIDFAFRFNGAGWADVLENGVYQSGGDTPYQVGDVFRVAIVGGRVQYFKNGTFLRESSETPTYPLLLDVSLGSLGASVHDAILAVTPPPPPGGGFIEKAGSPALRPRFTRTEIEQFLPPGGTKGAFTFPAPYNTKGIRLTDASDCIGGQDCLWYVGYSYWRNINNHVASDSMYIFLGTDPAHGGVGPVLLRYNKQTDAIENLGPLFNGPPYSYSTGEGWYFSALHPTRLYAYLVGSPQLRRYDILLREFEPTPALDLDRCPRPQICPRGAAFIIQPHSSDDDLVHSATVQDINWQRIGCVVYDAAIPRFKYFAAARGYVLDECHVDKSGGWLILLETRTDGSRRNRIINLDGGRTATIEDVNGALGHLDTGFGYATGADTFNPLPNATILLDFPVSSTTRPVGPVVHYNKRWDIAAANHVAHGNARSVDPPEYQYACGSNASRVLDMADEIVCFSLNANRNADGSLDVLVVGQVMTDLDALGGRDFDGDDYEQIPKGNLDVTGRYFLWTTNLGGERLDAFLVQVPAERFGETTSLPLRTRRGRSSR